MSRRISKKKAQAKIAQLEIKKRNGLMRCIAAIVCMVVLIAVKLSFTYAGAEWANSMVANGALFILALVAAGFAGIGSRDWTRARKEIEGLQQQMRG